MRKRRIILIAAVLFGLFTQISIPDNHINPVVTVQAASVKLSKKTAVIQKGKSVKLKVIGAKKKVVWKSSNKKVASVSKSGNVIGKNKGLATITAKVGSKKLRCKVIIKEGKSYTGTSTMYGIKTSVKINSNKDVKVNITNNSSNIIRLGWPDTSMFVFKTTKGTYYIRINVLKSVQNGGIDYSYIYPGETSTYTGNISNVPGIIKAMQITDVCPLNNNKLPVLNWNSVLKYTLNVNLH